MMYDMTFGQHQVTAAPAHSRTNPHAPPAHFARARRPSPATASASASAFAPCPARVRMPVHTHVHAHGHACRHTCTNVLHANICARQSRPRTGDQPGPAHKSGRLACHSLARTPSARTQLVYNFTSFTLASMMACTVFFWLRLGSIAEQVRTFMDLCIDTHMGTRIGTSTDIHLGMYTDIRAGILEWCACLYK